MLIGKGHRLLPGHDALRGHVSLVTHEGYADVRVREGRGLLQPPVKLS